jgi:hypothetical protein
LKYCGVIDCPLQVLADLSYSYLQVSQTKPPGCYPDFPCPCKNLGVYLWITVPLSLCNIYRPDCINVMRVKTALFARVSWIKKWLNVWCFGMSEIWLLNKWRLILHILLVLKISHVFLNFSNKIHMHLLFLESFQFMRNYLVLHR